jgi:hypothetical protein
MGEIRNACKILAEKLKEKYPLGRVGVNGSIIIS